MKRKFNLIVICMVILLIVCGCGKDTDNLSSKDLKELRELIENNNEAITELTAKNTELENKIAALEEENKNLKESSNNLVEKVADLKESDKKISNNVSSNYEELKKLINSKQKSSNSYTISKNELLGTWKFGSSSITFTNENTKVFNNWIIFKNDEGESRAVYYMYKDRKLHITQFGGVFTK